MRRQTGRQLNIGFTLVEIIVTLTILALLAAMLVPQLLGYYDNAKLQAEYEAGECCLAAAQMELDSIRLNEMAPNYEHQNLEVDGGCPLWSAHYVNPVILMANQDIAHLYIGVGRYSYYQGLEDDSPAYTVYLMAYQRTADSPIVYYNGGQWSETCTWSDYNSTNNPMVTVNGQPICMQFYTIKYNHATEGRPETFFNQSLAN